MVERILKIMGFIEQYWKKIFIQKVQLFNLSKKKNRHLIIKEMQILIF